MHGMLITDHAADRFIQRLAPEMSRLDAKSVLRRASLRAQRMTSRTYAGQTMWSTDDARGAVLVVKHDPQQGQVVVTVLAPEYVADTAADEEEVIAAFARARRAEEERQAIVEANRSKSLADRERREGAESRLQHEDLEARYRREAEANKARRAVRANPRAEQDRLKAEAKRRRAEKHAATIAAQQAAAAKAKADRAAKHEANMLAAKQRRKEREELANAAREDD